MNNPRLYHKGFPSHPVRRDLRIGETIATVIAEPEFISIAEADVNLQRSRLHEYLRLHPGFLTSLQPLPAEPSAPPIVSRMASAAARAGVGPMAAVAGAIADSAVRAMFHAGCRHAVFDNGGDIALITQSPVVVGIYAGRAAVRELGFRVRPSPRILGICTSSATVGHSFSFGRADAAIVIAPDVPLADAAATALGNAVKTDSEVDLRMVLESFFTPEIEGMAVIQQDHFGLIGRLPEIIEVTGTSEHIAKG